MSWWKRLFGGEKEDEDDYVPGVVDIRSSSEREIEKKAKKPLSGKHEATAHTLCRLSRESQSMGDTQFEQMKSIGAQLHSQGGKSLMQTVCYRVRALGGSHSYVSTAWDGVGEWRD